MISAISGVEWEEAWADRVEGPLGRHRVALLGRETFIRNKRAAARPKDLADIDALRPGESNDAYRSAARAPLRMLRIA